MAEHFFDEMKRYVRFDASDETALRSLCPHATPLFPHIAGEFYERLLEHEGSRAVLAGGEQVARLKSTLCDWLLLLLSGPWDRAYYERRARIGRKHVTIGLPQRYMFGAMDLIRTSLMQVARDAFAVDQDHRLHVNQALVKVTDLELAIMLETYREAFIEKVQHLERLEKNSLERRLAISEARYEEIVEKAEALISTFDPAGTIHLFNRRCEELTGLPRATAFTRSWFEIFVPAERRASVRALCNDALSGRRVAPYEGPFPCPPSGERRVRWHLTTLPSATGPVLCAIGLDVTEEQALAMRTHRAERLASLGTMAAGLAHEIRNPLNAAHLQLTLVQRRLSRPTGTDVNGAIAAAELAASEMRRLALLVEEFLQFARPQPLRLSRVDLHATAEVIVSLVTPEAVTAGVELTLAPGERVMAEIDDEKMKQVLLNLLRNAMEATGHGGHVRVTVGTTERSPGILVEDDGPGLSSLEAPIFEPFYTTKPGGTGLGLAIVHRIVSDHLGRVNVESRPGRTVFSILLPELPA